MKDPILNITPGAVGEVNFTTKVMLPEEAPHSFAIVGRIDSVSLYIENKGNHTAKADQCPGNTKSLITVDESKGTIKLIIDATDRYSSSITGNLKLSDEIEKFKINTTKWYSRDELINLIRFNQQRIIPAQAILAELRRLKFSATTSVEDKKRDNRGNHDSMSAKVVTTNLPEQFSLEIPLYKGMLPVKFMVDLIVNTTESNVQFALESTELAELLETLKEACMDEEIEKLEDSGIVIIYEN